MRSHGQWPLARAALAGTLAYLTGYLLVYLGIGPTAAGSLTDVTIRDRAFATGFPLTDPTLPALVGELSRPMLAAWAFANAHHVRVVEWSYPTTGAVVPNLVLVGPPGRLILLAVPPLVLGLAGALLARNASLGTVDELPVLRITLPAGLVRGMAVWVGYLPAAVVVSFLASAPTDHPSLAPLAPGLIGTILLMGIVYPLVFGGLGGLLVTRIRGDRDTDDDIEPSTTS